MRGAMIGVGTLLIQKFTWILYLFGAFLLYAGFKLFGAEHSIEPDKNPVTRWVRKILPVSQSESGARLFTREGGRWMATPLFLVVVVLETTDLVFAVDSIPAVLAVTRDPFVVYTSNVMVRFWGCAHFIFYWPGSFPYFQYLDEAAFAVVLMFIGAKMLAEPWVHISTEVSLAIVGSVIAIAVAVSDSCSEEISRYEPKNARYRVLNEHCSSGKLEHRSTCTSLTKPGNEYSSRGKLSFSATERSGYPRGSEM